MGTRPDGVGGGSRLRAHAGRSFPPHGAVPPMANGQKTGRLHLRSTRGGSAAGAGRDFPSRPLRLPRLLIWLLLTPLPPFARRIIIRVGSLVPRPELFGHMTEIDSDAGPGR